MADELIVGDHNFQQFLPGNVVVSGESKAHGLVPRNYTTHPVGYYAWAPPASIKVISRNEWSDRIKQKIAEKSQLSDIRLNALPNNQPIPSRDQNGKGFCWGHSTTSACLILRALANDPYADLSAYAVCCKIKNFQDQGGWGAESLDFIIKNGIPTSEFWPQRSMSHSNDNPNTWANAALHKVTESWMDINAQEYDRTMTFDQEATLLLTNTPVVKDENWWSHSICGLDLVDGTAQYGITRVESGKLATLQEFEFIWGMNTVAAGYGVRIWNSWGDSWSDRGMGVLTGSKAVSDGAVAPLTIEASES